MRAAARLRAARRSASSAFSRGTPPSAASRSSQSRSARNRSKSTFSMRASVSERSWQNHSGKAYWSPAQAARCEAARTCRPSRMSP
eukprot:7328063-Prymnesium_polylepis.1